MAFSASYVYALVDRYSAKLKKITAVTRSFQKRIKSTSVSVRKFGNTMKSVGRKMTSFIGTAAATMALFFPIRAAINFESKMADVRKAMNDIRTPAQLKLMKKIISSTSVYLGLMPEQVADLATAAGKMGIPLTDMKEFLHLAGSAAVAFDMSGEMAGTVIGKIKDQYKLSLAGTKNLLDAVNYLADNTSARAEDMLQILTRMQSKFNSLKFPTEVAAGWSAAAARLSVSPQIAASGLDMIMSSIQKKLPKLTKAMDIDPSAALIDHFTELSNLPLNKLRTQIAEIYGTGAGADLALSYATNLDVLKHSISLTAEKTKYMNSMGKELEIKMATASFKIKQMTAGLKLAAIALGEVLLPYIKRFSKWMLPIIERITEWIKNNQTAAKWIMILVGVLAILGPVLVGIGIIIQFAFAPMTLIVAGIILGIAALIAIFIYWGTVVKYIKKKFIELWNWCKPAAIILAVIFGPAIVTVLALVGAVKALIWAYKKLAEMRKETKEKIGKKGSFGGITPEEADYIMSDEIYSKKDINHSVNHNPQSVTMNGQINVGVDGGKVKSSSLETSTGGNLGFNNPAYSH